ncbi:MAG: hypothetical protein OXG60_19865 [Chloroflexi bacterium]|nr:hypothetical protein [Chloroflexota bacterium]
MQRSLEGVGVGAARDAWLIGGMMVERAPVGSRVAGLVSGLDSCIMTGLLAREYAEVTPLFVRAGLRWEDAELAALARFLARWTHRRCGRS